MKILSFIVYLTEIPIQYGSTKSEEKSKKKIQNDKNIMKKQA